MLSSRLPHSSGPISYLALQFHSFNKHIPPILHGFGLPLPSISVVEIQGGKRAFGLAQGLLPKHW